MLGTPGGQGEDMTLAPPASDVRPAARIDAVDVLRGVVMVLMAIDHTRDYVHGAAMAFQPEDLSQTTPAIFMTRWITHVCAPVFMFCAGIGAFLKLQRGGTARDLSRFLLTRGLWLVVLEFTVVRASFFFDLQFSPLILLVFWALGVSMIVLAALIHLPFSLLAAISIGLIALHNLLDGIPAAQFGSFAWVWQILHARGVWITGGPIVLVAYPLIPWMGVMAAGFCFGRVYLLAPAERRTLLLWLGTAATLAFLALRALNVHGDPAAWTTQRNAVYTLLSFLNTTKYPPSLLFLLMTLGPAMLFLASAERLRLSSRNPLIVFGRVPLFYFIVHIPLIHLLAIGLTWARYGDAPFLFLPPPTLGTPRDAFPPDYGWSLGSPYAAWLVVLMLLYPLCLWFSRVKARRRAWWVSYL